MSIVPAATPRRSRLMLAVAAAAALAWTSPPREAGAAASPAVRCEAKKLVTAGRVARAILRCHAAAAKTGATVDAGCVADAAAGLSEKFAKLDASATCTTTGDAPMIADDVDAFVAEVVAALRPQLAASACAAAELQATANGARDVAKAIARDKRKPDVERLQDDLTRLSSRLSAVFSAAQQAGDCQTSSDAGAIAQTVYEDLGVRVAGRLFPTCGDGVVGPGEQCDGTDGSSCAGVCQADCTCPPPVCGNQVVESGEDCDGTTCPTRNPQYGPHGCFPAGDPSECECCGITDDVCYIQDVFLTIPCCPGFACVIPPRQPHNTGECRPACSQQSDCPAGDVCFCRGCEGPYPACGQQSDCAADRLCINGGCFGPLLSCSASSCPPGWVCTSNPQLCLPVECGP
jgi:hypothetical protein